MSDDRITNPHHMDDDEPELSLRPRRLREFIGQPRLKENLQVAIARMDAAQLEYRGHATATVTPSPR